MRTSSRRAKRQRDKQQQRVKVEAQTPPPLPELIQIEPGEVDELWILAEQFIGPALVGSELSVEEAQQQCRDGDAELWFAWSDHLEAAAMTHLISTPSGLVCVLAACGGTERDRWLQLLHQIELWAAGRGCFTMRIFGRKGWARVLPGYRMKRIILDKEL